MATQQLVRCSNKTSSKSDSWTSVFPLEQKTEQQSLLFVKKLVAVCLSSVTYLRGIFPEQAYADRNAQGINLKILLDRSCSPAANTLVGWIRGCFDAIEKHYLRQMTLAIFDENSDTEVDPALETYTFRFTYKPDGEVMMDQVETKSGQQNQKYEVRRPTLQMLRTIIMLTQTLQPLCENVVISMKLLYYDDVTPKDYEPVGFKPAETEGFHFSNTPFCVQGGDVKTPFHCVKLRVRLDKKQLGDSVSGVDEGCDSLMEVDDETEMERVRNTLPKDAAPIAAKLSLETGAKQLRQESENEEFLFRSKLNPRRCPSLMMDQPNDSNAKIAIGALPIVSPDGKVSSVSSLASVFEGLRTPQIVPEGVNLSKDGAIGFEEAMDTASVGSSTPRTPKQVVETPSVSGTIRSAHQGVSPSMQEYSVRCPCQVNLDDGLMILCDKCKDWQHAACFGILNQDDAPTRHICEGCASPVGERCTDPQLPLLPLKQGQMFCLYRRFLSSCNEYEGNITAAMVTSRLGTNITKGKYLLDQLVAEGILVSGVKKGFKVIDNEKLKNSQNKAFLHNLNAEKQIMDDVGKTVAKSVVKKTPQRNDSLLDSDATPDIFCKYSGKLLLPHSDTAVTQTQRVSQTQDVPIGSQHETEATCGTMNSTFRMLDSQSCSQTQEFKEEDETRTVKDVPGRLSRSKRCLSMGETLIRLVAGFLTQGWTSRRQWESLMESLNFLAPLIP